MVSPAVALLPVLPATVCLILYLRLLTLDSIAARHMNSIEVLMLVAVVAYV